MIRVHVTLLMGIILLVLNAGIILSSTLPPPQHRTAETQAMPIGIGVFLVALGVYAAADKGSKAKP